MKLQGRISRGRGKYVSQKFETFPFGEKTFPQPKSQNFTFFRQFLIFGDKYLPRDNFHPYIKELEHKINHISKEFYFFAALKT